MDTHRSEKIVETYLERKGRLKRKELEFSGTIKAKAEEIFPLLCPVREGDWVKNWTCDMIYSESGAAEEKCVFRTTGANPYHTGLWTFTEYKKNRSIAFVRLEKNIISHNRIDLSENGDRTAATWRVISTALNENGNSELAALPGSTPNNKSRVIKMLTDYFSGQEGNTSDSNRIAEKFQAQKTKLLRKNMKFSGTWDATPGDVFTLLCPAREADWIPTWTSDIIYSTTGYAEDKCVFTTGGFNVMGSGVWTFTGFKKNEYVKFVCFRDHVIIHACITVKDNGDGTTTGTWDVSMTALNEKGNKKVGKMKGGTSTTGPVVPMIEHYLETGKRISILALPKIAIHG